MPGSPLYLVSERGKVYDFQVYYIKNNLSWHFIPCHAEHSESFRGDIECEISMK